MITLLLDLLLMLHCKVRIIHTINWLLMNQKILVIRNDKLGDFMLAFPSFAMLKQNLPEAEIHALVPKYTQAIAEQCQYIDKCITDPGEKAGVRQLVTVIRQQHYDAVITLYSTSRIAIATFLTRIPYRLAPATKIAQIFYNHRLRQRRSRSEKPEYAYNLDLIKQFLRDFSVAIEQQPEKPYLHFDQNSINTIRDAFCQKYIIDSNLPIVFIHPGSGGSANNLCLDQYADIARQLAQNRQLSIVISTGPGEEHIGQNISNRLNNVPHICYRSSQGMVRFAQHIQMADLFISGSTGPLHIAGALDVPTVGFYPRRRSATSLRWETLNSPERRLAISPQKCDESDMSRIDTKMASDTILEFYAPIFADTSETEEK